MYTFSFNAELPENITTWLITYTWFVFQDILQKKALHRGIYSAKATDAYIPYLSVNMATHEKGQSKSPKAVMTYILRGRLREAHHDVLDS